MVLCFVLKSEWLACLCNTVLEFWKMHIWSLNLRLVYEYVKVWCVMTQSHARSRYSLTHWEHLRQGSRFTICWWQDRQTELDRKHYLNRRKRRESSSDSAATFHADIFEGRNLLDCRKDTPHPNSLISCGHTTIFRCSVPRLAWVSDKSVSEGLSAHDFQTRQRVQEAEGHLLLLQPSVHLETWQGTQHAWYVLWENLFWSGWVFSTSVRRYQHSHECSATHSLTQTKPGHISGCQWAHCAPWSRWRCSTACNSASTVTHRGFCSVCKRTNLDLRRFLQWAINQLYWQSRVLSRVWIMELFSSFYFVPCSCAVKTACSMMDFWLPPSHWTTTCRFDRLFELTGWLTDCLIKTSQSMPPAQDKIEEGAYAIVRSLVPPPEASKPAWWGDQARALTQAVCFCMICWGLLIPARHSNTVLSLPPDASSRPSWDHCSSIISCLH